MYRGSAVYARLENIGRVGEKTFFLRLFTMVGLATLSSVRVQREKGLNDEVMSSTPVLLMSLLQWKYLCDYAIARGERSLGYFLIVKVHRSQVLPLTGSST